MRQTHMMIRPLVAPALTALVLLVSGCTATTESTTPADAPTTHTPESVTAGEEVSPTATPTSARVKVEMGHCFVEPVAFDGERWNVPRDKQFGTGGLQPANWRGTGVMTRVGEDRARFKDRGGAVVVFRPVDDPAVRGVENAICY